MTKKTRYTFTTTNFFVPEVINFAKKQQIHKLEMQKSGGKKLCNYFLQSWIIITTNSFTDTKGPIHSVYY